MLNPGGMTKKMDTDTLRFIVKLRQKFGVHVDYQYGLNIGGNLDWEFVFPDPKYDGCSLRVFIYNQTDSYAKVRMNWPKYETTYFCSVGVKDKSLEIDGGGKSSYKNETPLKPTTGGFFSIGIRMAKHMLYPLFNNYAGEGYDMGESVTPVAWKTKIYSGKNHIVSLHICNEENDTFPDKGLNHRFSFENFVLPIGSYVTVFAVVEKNPEKIWIGFKQGDQDYPGYTIGNSPLKINDEIRILACNSNRGWILAGNFLGHNQDALIVSRQKQEQHTDVELSDNCFIRRIHAVCAAIPVKYRVH